jgi:hypothetical protein
MIRVACAAAALVAALGAGCSAGEGGAAVPTAPTSTPSTTGSTGGGGSPTTSSCLPAAPGNFRVTVTDSMRVFTWNSVTNVQDYFIQIAINGHDDFLVNTNTTQTTYTWSGYAPGNYWARVYARNSCGSGPNSAPISFN